MTKEEQLGLDQYKLRDSHKFDDMVQDCFNLHKVAFSRRNKRLSESPELFDDKDFEYVLDPETKQPVDF